MSGASVTHAFGRASSVLVVWESWLRPPGGVLARRLLGRRRRPRCRVGTARLILTINSGALDNVLEELAPNSVKCGSAWAYTLSRSRKCWRFSRPRFIMYPLMQAVLRRTRTGSRWAPFSRMGSRPHFGTHLRCGSRGLRTRSKWGRHGVWRGPRVRLLQHPREHLVDASPPDSRRHDEHWLLGAHRARLCGHEGRSRDRVAQRLGELGQCVLGTGLNMGIRRESALRAGSTRLRPCRSRRFDACKSGKMEPCWYHPFCGHIEKEDRRGTLVVVQARARPAGAVCGPSLMS